MNTCFPFLLPPTIKFRITHGASTTPQFLFSPSLIVYFLFSFLFSSLLITYTPAPQPTSNSSETEPVASLASRISGLTTSSEATSKSSETPPAPAPEVKGSETRPKFNAGGNNLFGRALAGAKSDRPAASTSTSTSTSSPTTATPTPKSESKVEKKEEMTNPNLMDNDDGKLSRLLRNEADS